jgi:hypothetical protein
MDNSFSYSLFFWQALVFTIAALWMYCLVDILKSKFERNDKVFWFLGILAVPFFGSILYLTRGKKTKIQSK